MKNMKTTLWHSVLRRCLLLGGTALCLWLIDFNASAQAPGFFAGGPAVSITAAQSNRGESVYDVSPSWRWTERETCQDLYQRCQ
jgi:hypothetical protein